MTHPAYYAPSSTSPPAPGGQIVVPYVPRGPLPPLWPPALHDYDKVLPWVPPQTRDYLRADAWGVVVPGLPFLPGLTSSEHPERLLTWFLPEWPEMWQDIALRTYCARGYRHFFLSVPDRGPLDIPKLVETCQRVKRYKAENAPDPLYVCMFLATKVATPKDMTVSEWIRYVDPLLDALLPVVDEVIPAWEWNAFNIPSNAGGPSVDVPKYIGRRAHEHGVSCWLHYLPHYTNWHADGSNRFVFWDQLGEDVDGLLYQGVFEHNRNLGRLSWTIDELQSRIVDTLHHFGRAGNRWKFRMFEYQAYYSWTRDRPNEDDQNLAGYLACCTVDNVHRTDARVWGSGQGIRYPDGRVL